MRRVERVEVGSGALPLSRRRWLLSVMRVLNMAPKLILRSPLHGFMSSDTMLLAFEGRVSRRPYVIPVAYMEDEGALLVATDRPWRKNIRTGERIVMWLRGCEREAWVEVISAEAEMGRLFARILLENPTLGRFLGLRLDADGGANAGDLRRAVERGAAIIRLSPERG